MKDIIAKFGWLLPVLMVITALHAMQTAHLMAEVEPGLAVVVWFGAAIVILTSPFAAVCWLGICGIRVWDYWQARDREVSP